MRFLRLSNSYITLSVIWNDTSKVCSVSFYFMLSRLIENFVFSISWNDTFSYTSCVFFGRSATLMLASFLTHARDDLDFFQPLEKINGAWMFHKNAPKKRWGGMELSSSKKLDWSEPSWQLRLLRSVDRPSAIWRPFDCRTNFLPPLFVPV